MSVVAPVVPANLNALRRKIVLTAALGAVETLQNRRPESGACYRRVGKGYAVFHRVGDLANRALELDGVVTEGHIDDIEDFFRQRESSVRIVIHNEAAAPELVTMLQNRQYEKTVRIATRWRPLPWIDTRTDTAHVTVIEVEEDKVATWARTIRSGFHEETGPSHDEIDKDELGDACALALRDGCQAFLAVCAGDPAGGAVLQMQDGVALLRTTSTRFVHRHKGVQQALIARRLACASDRGCRLAFSMAHIGSASERNLARFGFVLFEEGCAFSRQLTEQLPRQPQ